jgi:predicted porin
MESNVLKMMTAWCWVVSSMCASSIQASEVLSDVRIGGDINLAVVRYQLSGSEVNDSTSTRLDSYTSRYFIRGLERLSDTLSAEFLLGSGFRADTGAGGFCGRQCLVGLRSPVGSIKLGRTLPIYDDLSYFWYNDDAPGNHNPAALWANCGGSASLQSGCFDVFQNDSIRYDSPKLLGVSFSASWSRPDSDAPIALNPNVSVFGFQYEDDIYRVGIAYQSNRETRESGSGDTALTLAASRKGFVEVGLAFERLSYGTASGQTVARSYFGWLLSYRIGRHKVWNNAGVSTRGRGSTPVDYTINAVKNLTKSGALMVALGYQYNLSKSTLIYSFVNVLRNDANGTYSFDPSLDATMIKGATLYSYAVGLKVHF